jgi:hypothetical protein
MTRSLQVIEHRNQRVLTTQQLAEGYGTDTTIISNNFNRNKERYIPGKYYFILEGEDKREFVNRHQFADGSKNATQLYLWTEKGALLHAKSLNTDKAWEVYGILIDTYFRVKESGISLEQLQSHIVAPMVQRMALLEQRMVTITLSQVVEK